MNFHLLHHLCDEWDKFCSIQVLEAISCEHFNVLLKRHCHRKPVGRVTRIRETASAVKRIVAGMKLEGRYDVRTDQLVKASRLQTLEGMACLLPRDVSHINCDNLVRMNISDY